MTAPPPDTGARLGSPDRVLRLRRLRLAGGRPLILQTSYLPWPAADGLDPAELAERGIYPVLAERGLAVTRATETITPGVLEAAEARCLDRPAGRPALRSHRLSFTAAGLAILDDHAVLPGDAVAITASRSVGSLDVRYTLAPGQPGRPPSPAADPAPGRAQRRPARRAPRRRPAWLYANSARVVPVVSGPDHGDRPVRMVHAVGADRAEQHVGEPAVPAAPDHQQVGTLGRPDQDVGRVYPR